jgi:hypothetical protein
MKPLFFLFKLFLGVPLLGLAQNHFEGFIYDAKKKEPLPFVHFIALGIIQNNFSLGLSLCFSL